MAPRTLLLVLALALAACSAGQATPAGPELRLVQLNLCGHRNALPEGCVGDGRAPEERVSDVARLLADLEPHVVTLNEACEDDVQEIRAEVTAAGWPLDHAFDATAGGPWSTCGSRSYGNAVLVHGEVVGDVRHYSLSTAESPEAGWERRGAVCADTRITGHAGRATACATHLIPPTFDAAEHDRQLAGLAGVMAAERRRTVPLVLGGDLNADPAVTRPLLRALGLVDDEGPPTYQRRKYDYLFTTADLGERREVEAREVASSDHRAVVLRLSSRLRATG